MNIKQPFKGNLRNMRNPRNIRNCQYHLNTLHIILQASDF